MPEQIFLNAEGESSGELKGNSFIRDFQNQIEILSADFELDIPVRADDLTIVGRRRYKPLTIRKLMDRSSALFLRMITTNEPFKIFELTFLSHSEEDRLIRGRGLRPAFRITLTGAFVSNYTAFQAPVEVAVNPNSIPMAESISICFSTIQFTDLVNKLEMIDEIAVTA